MHQLNTGKATKTRVDSRTTGQRAIRPIVYFIRTFETELGWFGFIRDSNETLLQTKIGFECESELFQALRESLESPTKSGSVFTELLPGTTQFDKSLEREMKRYAKGHEVDWKHIKVDISGLTDFQKKVIRLCRKIPFGKTLSYGELARKVGADRAARAVGSVMAQNRFPVVVPCHRVVAANNRLGGFSAPNGVNFKKRMLELESVETICS